MSSFCSSFAYFRISALQSRTKSDTSSFSSPVWHLILSINSHWLWNFLKIRISCPWLGLMRVEKTAPITSSIMWWRHAKCERFFLGFVSIRIQGPFFLPVLDAVVSKHMTTTFSANPHFSSGKTKGICLRLRSSIGNVGNLKQLSSA